MQLMTKAEQIIQDLELLNGKVKLTIDEAKELEEQIKYPELQKYLTSNDFLILTNLNDAFLFNRDALIDYKPFLKIKFTDLLKEFLDSENLWDTVRRMEDQFVKPEL